MIRRLPLVFVLSVVALWPLSATGPFTIVLLPDTQHYVETPERAALLDQQVQWIVEQRDPMNIVFVAHLGDTVETKSDAVQYGRVSAAMGVLEQAGIIFGLLPGNHDGTKGSASLYHNYFGAPRFNPYWWHVGMTFYKNTQRPMASCQEFPGSDGDYLHCGLGWLDPVLGPNDTLENDADDTEAMRETKKTLRFVDARIAERPNHKAILTFHDFITPTGGWSAGAQRTFQMLILPWLDRVVFVANGHQLGQQAEALRVEAGVPLMLSNYQSRACLGSAKCGAGWLRYLVVDPAAATCSVYTYSPWLDQHETDENSQFVVGC